MQPGRVSYLDFTSAHNVCPRENTKKTSTAPGLWLEVFSAAAGEGRRPWWLTWRQGTATRTSSVHPQAQAGGGLASLDTAFDTEGYWEGEALG